jgi:SET domain-containing protein
MNKHDCRGIEVKISPRKGRGVFATKNFKIGDIIEIAPTLRLTPKERKNAAKTVLNYYMYPWRSTRSASIVLGYGSLYNHSFEPNADWKQDFRSRNMVYRALKPIKAGEEITVNYNGEPDDMTPVDWMEDQPPMQP